MDGPGDGGALLAMAYIVPCNAIVPGPLALPCLATDQAGLCIVFPFER